MSRSDYPVRKRAAHADSVTGRAAHRADTAGVPDGTAWLRRAFWILFAALTLAKLVLAARLSPFVDEAFYWQESRHLALAYSDLPPLTAWLIRLGETLFGHGVLAMRVPFMLLGALMPLLMVHFASRLQRQYRGDPGTPFQALSRSRTGKNRQIDPAMAHSPSSQPSLPNGEAVRERVGDAGWIAGIFTLLLPLAGTLGILALPDVPLTFAALLALVTLDRAATDNRLRDWLILGLALALAALTHYRVAMLLLAGLIFLCATPRGRLQWKRSGLWIALGIAVLSLLPTLIFNLRHAWSGLAFQAVDRQQWGFHASALIQPLEQMLVTTPLLWLLLVGVLIAALRRVRHGAPWDLIGTSAAVFLIGYFALGLFGDDQRFRVHWPLPGYLALIAVLPLIISEWRHSARLPAWLIRGYATGAATLAALGTAAVIAYLACAASPTGSTWLARYKVFPENFVGWHEIGDLTKRTLAEPRFDTALLVADNFMLAAELDFALNGTRPLWSLDHPLNTKHGRATQLAIWQRDEASLREFPGRSVVLVVEETAPRERDRRTWLASVCGRIADPMPIARIDLYHGRKRFALYAGSVPQNPATPRPVESCEVWQAAWKAGLQADP